MKRSIYYIIFRYIYLNSSPKEQEYYKLILEQERIKRINNYPGKMRCKK